MAQNALIASVPHDVLRQIFSLVFWSRDGRLPPMTKKRHQKVQRVALVCKDWKEAVSSMDELYATIRVDASSFSVPHCGRTPGKFMEQCIQASGNHPLSITIFEINDLVVAVGVFKVLQDVSVSRRLEYLSVHLKDMVDAVKESRISGEELVPIHAPNLQHLFIAHTQYVSVDLSDILRVSSSLTRLDVDMGLPAFSRIAGSQMPWYSLTHIRFHIDLIANSEYLEVLSLMPGLRSLEIYPSESMYSAGYRSSQRLVVLEELRYLRFDSSSCGVFSDMLDQICLPRLEHVYFNNSINLSDAHVKCARRILKRLSKTVTELTLYRMHIGLGFLFAPALPNLRKLTMDAIDYRYTPTLYPEPMAKQFLSKLPRLEELWLDCSSWNDQFVRLLYPRLSERNKKADGSASGDSSMRPARLAMHFPRLKKEQVAKASQELGKFGLEVNKDVFF
ncbi:hypothetical protein AX17_005052 [Amanita inopinata Kibby_2008]|nr:hypothetical protein AX17_005052 [Amanita inopinata Kibby_2008]